jgi:hypothetical protein
VASDALDLGRQVPSGHRTERIARSLAALRMAATCGSRELASGLSRFCSGMVLLICLEEHTIDAHIGPVATTKERRVITT